MTYSLDDTIAAIASPPGGAIRGIVRLSGPAVVNCLAECFRAEDGRDLKSVSRAEAIPGTICLPPPLGVVPAELLLWPDHRSYTRQPVGELHTFGSPPLLDAALRTVCAAGARLATPGEFTLRAFLAGRIDLTQAEAVLGVIEAANQQELQVSLSQLAGGLAGPLQSLRDQLLDLLAHLEAGLDFADEDIRFIATDELRTELTAARESVERLAARMVSRGEVADEFRVVLRGEPNVGKSSLLNALAGESAAIVSDLAGTTRDYVSRRIDIGGRSCLLIDTAGVEPATTSPLVAAAQATTSTQFARAHVELLCLDGSRPLSDWERAELQRTDDRRLVVITKADFLQFVLPPGLQTVLPTLSVLTSAVERRGIDELRAAIVARLRTSSSAAGVVAGTAVRCADSLRLASDSLRQAAEVLSREELVAAEIRLALEELGKVAGVVYTDDVLDRIFSRFCIGK